MPRLNLEVRFHLPRRLAVIIALMYGRRPPPVIKYIAAAGSR